MEELSGSYQGNNKFMSNKSVITILMLALCTLLTVMGTNKWVGSALIEHKAIQHSLTIQEFDNIKESLKRIESNQVTGQQKILDKIDKLK